MEALIKNGIRLGLIKRLKEMLMATREVEVEPEPEPEPKFKLGDIVRLKGEPFVGKVVAVNHWQSKNGYTVIFCGSDRLSYCQECHLKKVHEGYL